MSRTREDLVASYLRSLQWQVPIAIVAVLALWGFDVGGMREGGIGRALLIVIGFSVVLSPLLWLRYEFRWQYDKQLAVLLGCAIVWMAVGTLIMFQLVALVDR